MFVLLVIVLFIIVKKEYDEESIIFDKTRLMRWLIISIPQVIYFYLVSISAAFVVDRYLFPIYTVAFCLFLCMMNTIWRKLVSVKYTYIIMCLIGTVFIVNGFGNAQWDYLYKTSLELLNEAQMYSDKNCISVYDKNWKEQSSFCEIKKYKSVTFISKSHVNNILQHSNLFEDGFMLNIIGGNHDSIISMIQESCPYLNQCEKIGEFTYSTTYYISAGEKSHNVHIYDYDRNNVIGVDGFDLRSNVLLTQNGQDVWLVMQDDDYVVIEIGRFVLDIAGAQYRDGTNVQMYDSNHTDAQKWRLVGNEDGSFCLLAKDEKFALTYGRDGNVYLAEYHKEERSQKWWIE